jgi:hypothetical protein
MTHNNEYCPKYKDKVLPNEEGNCSLCNAELTEEELGRSEKSGIGVKSIEKIKAEKAKANISQPLPDWQIPKPYRELSKTK